MYPLRFSKYFLKSLLENYAFVDSCFSVLISGPYLKKGKKEVVAICFVVMISNKNYIFVIFEYCNTNCATMGLTDFSVLFFQKTVIQLLLVDSNSNLKSQQISQQFFVCLKHWFFYIVFLFFFAKECKKFA